MTLFEQMIAESNLFAAWDRVANNDGVAGIDGIEIEDFELKLSGNVHRLHLSLAQGEYSPAPLRRSFIPKESGDLRALAIPTVRDRLAQTACTLILAPLLEPTFEPSSHGYRPRRGIYTAMAQIELLRDEGYTWVVDADIDDFFDEVRHDLLLETLRNYVEDKRLLALIEAWLKAPILEGHLTVTPKQGLPQGSPIAPLLANVYLDAFDEAVVEQGLKLVRYADDFLVLCKEKPTAETALQVVDALLDDLKLSLEPGKTRITSFGEGFDYLGAHYQNDLVIPPRNQAEPAGTEIPEGFALPNIAPGSPDYMPRYPLLRCLYVETQGASLRKDQGRFRVQKGNKVIFEVPCIKIEHIIIFGTAHVSTPAMKYCLTAGIPITFLSSRGQYYGRLENPRHAQVQLHALQFVRAGEPVFALETARRLLSAKLANSRTLLVRARRNRRVTGVVPHAAGELAQLIKKLVSGSSLEELWGLEGQAAKLYYRAFASLLNDPMGFEGRNRRPPRDPVNALLSFGYTLLFYNIYSLLRINGLNPYVGNLHTVRDHSPSLASDLMEEFRAPIIDSLVLQLVNKRTIRPEHFTLPRHPDDPCLLTRNASRSFVSQFEQRIRTEVVHPHTGYRVDWRRCIQLQIQAYKRYLKDPSQGYQGMTTR